MLLLPARHVPAQPPPARPAPVVKIGVPSLEERRFRAVTGQPPAPAVPPPAPPTPPMAKPEVKPPDRHG